MKGCAKGSGPHLEALCANCEANGYEMPEEIQHLWFLFSLHRGGFPFRRDDLTVEEWIRLGMLREEIDAMKAGVKRD
jgi:hypothetical protein